jgi:tetratricopeptide (TPR) repeat protein
MTSSDWSIKARMPVEMERKYELACNLWESGDLDQTIAVLQDCVAHDPLGDSPSPQELQDGKGVLICWIQLAVALLEADRPAEAVLAAERATQFGTLGSRAYNVLALSYSELGEHAESARAYQASLERRPDSTICVLLAYQLACLDRRDEGREVLLRALELEPDFDEAHYNLGCDAIYRQDWKQAEDHLRRAIELDPDYGVAHGQLGWTLLQRSARNDSIDSEAERHIRKAVELEPEDYWSRVYLGHVCWRTNLNDQAREHFEAATTILPSESGAQMFLGEFLFFSGVDVSRGKECLLKAIELDPENAGAQYLLGKALYREENDDEALEYFRRSLLLGDERAQEYIDFLEDSS